MGGGLTPQAMNNTPKTLAQLKVELHEALEATQSAGQGSHDAYLAAQAFARAHTALLAARKAADS